MPKGVYRRGKKRTSKRSRSSSALVPQPTLFDVRELAQRVGADVLRELKKAKPFKVTYQPERPTAKLDASLPAELQNKRFYVGSMKAIVPQGFNGRSWAKATLQDAVEHAKQILNSSSTGNVHHGNDFAFVVKIVKVVRRAPQPVVVQDVED